MNQRTHAWMAVRALALLDELNETPALVSMLKPHAKAAASGAWIPDLQDAKLGSGDIDNHVLKMRPFDGALKERYVVSKKELSGKLGPDRLMTQFIKQDSTLPDAWWAMPYKANPQPGQHLANRAMALTISLCDLLILGDTAVAALVPGTVSFAAKLDGKARSSAEQVAIFFFMLSHFVADACMPCHCDARPLAAYAGGLHMELEEHWSREVGTFFDKGKLEQTTASSVEVLKAAQDVDQKFNLSFPAAIPTIKSGDIWDEMMYICRGSFVISSIIANPVKFPYNSKKTAPFATIFNGDEGQKSLANIDRTLMQDAVLNIAIVWKHVWNRFK